jgi:hypothetical protein
MISKSSFIQAIQTLPDGASWTDIADALLRMVAHEGSTSDFVRLYRGQMTTESINEY